MNISLTIHSNRIIFISASKYHKAFKRLAETDDYYRFAFNTSLAQDNFSKEAIEDANALHYDIFTNNKVILGILKCYYPVATQSLDSNINCSQGICS